MTVDELSETTAAGKILIEMSRLSLVCSDLFLVVVWSDKVIVSMAYAVPAVFDDMATLCRSRKPMYTDFALYGIVSILCV